MSHEADFLAHSRILDEQIRSTLRKGSLYSAFLGLSSGLGLALLSALGLIENMLVPILWTAFGGIYSFAVYLLARKDRLKGAMVPFVLIGFTVLPTLIYVIAHFVLPSGAATYITGPPSYLYFFMIAISGFAFDPRVALACGISSGLQYFTVFLVDYRHLAIVQIPDGLMAQDMTAPPLYFSKAMMMVFTGMVVAVLSTTAKKLISGIVQQEREAFSIKRVLGAYVSTEVAEKIISDQSGRIAESKEVAILFSDIRGFTSFSEKHSPEQVVARLNEYFEAMVEAIQEHGGTVDKFIGDAVMAVFGGVLALQNPSQSAVLAAQAMRRRMDLLKKTWRDRGEEPFDNGIGIHFGPVLQGTIGPENRKDFTVIGDAVNLASRLESKCKELASTVLISQEVYAGIEAHEQNAFVFLGAWEVKGKSDEIKIYGLREN
ncbi:MAG: adenylate/guanylate cyclase domain-containing protein [Spirochaetia bacterium]|nr:adenylate/guanylate cyclase domain-containing protein [Spirochaetia bacterium]